MPRLNWSSRFARDFKRLARRNSQLRLLLDQTLFQLAEDPFHPSLETHKKVICRVLGHARSTTAIASCLNLLKILSLVKKKFGCQLLDLTTMFTKGLF